MPQQAKTLTLQSAALTAENKLSVDRDGGIIKNVAVLTVGVTRPSANGVDPFDVDGLALQQVADAINASEIGVKSRITHPEVAGQDDIGARLGYIRNARVVGDSVRADMHFHDPTSTHAITLMDIAEHDPTSAGLSLVSETAALEPSTESSTGLVMRLDRIDAVDWVGTPAGNPAGMLSARISLGATTMTEKQREFLAAQGLPWDATDEQTAAFIEAMDDEHKAQFEALKDAEAVEQAAEAAEEEGAGVAAQEHDREEEEDETSSGLTAGAAAAASSGVTLSADDAAQARKAERDRVQEIRQIALRCGYDEKWISKHIDGETEIGEVRRIALAGLQREPKDMTTTNVKVGADHNRDTLHEAVQDAIMLKAGARQFLSTDASGGVMLSADNRPQTRQPHERSVEFRGHTIIEMGRRYLIALGYQKAESMNRVQLADLLMSRSRLAGSLPGVYMAHATGDFPHLLADTMGKVLRAAYELAQPTWERWCSRRTAPDFKDIKFLQLSEASNLEEVPEGDDVKYGILTETKEVVALKTFAKGLKYTRRMLINDDLSAFDDGPKKLGTAAQRNIEDMAIALLTSNPTMAETGQPLFSTAHGNLTTGDLTPANAVATIDKMGVAMASQTPLGSDDPLDISPAYLIVPRSVKYKARVATSSTVDPSLANATPNPVADDQIEVISTARLDRDSNSQFYGVANPSVYDTAAIVFLEGQEAPVLMEEDEFDSDNRKIKVRHEVAAKVVDYRGFVRSSGS